MASIATRGLRKTFGSRVVALDDFGFEAADEKMTFLLGPSGAGKTTTLRLLAGLERPDEGCIEVDGRDITGLPPRDRNFAMVYDKHSLYPHLSVFENLAYPLRVRKMPEAAIRAKIAEVAEVLQIGRLLDRQPNQLSGGQMQRVAIGRALVRDANAFLLDEPISHLDAKLRAHMRVEFKKLQREFRATIIFVSHDQLEALTMADQIVVMDKGVKLQTGTPTDIYYRPANVFVASFVGEPGMNILPVNLLREGQATLLVSESFRLAFDDGGAASRDGFAGSREWLMGIRPQDIEMLRPGAGENVVEGRIFGVEELGSERIYDIELGGGGMLRVRTGLGPADGIPSGIGDPARCRVDPRRIYLFDRANGRTAVQARFAVAGLN
ncbi:ABC transporter ATP-binding protein [Chelativorans sp.]|uniref:ABC transporter ATP-binding protein n=1 Tax=Chelativorans sp. TaxID=2203393 RepID=UPI00281284D3|nr:ABC transporter ATP-binding protein [Chelativorans sp.]